MAPLLGPVLPGVPGRFGSLMAPLLGPGPPGVPGRLGSLIVPLLGPGPLLPGPPGVPGPVAPLPALPVPPAPPASARTKGAVRQRTAKVRMSMFVEVRYIAWLLCVVEGYWHGAQARCGPGLPCALCNGWGTVGLSNLYAIV